MEGINHFKEGEAEILRSVLARLEIMIERYPNIVPTKKIENLRKELSKWESGVDSERILLY